MESYSLYSFVFFSTLLFAIVSVKFTHFVVTGFFPPVHYSIVYIYSPWFFILVLMS